VFEIMNPDGSKSMRARSPKLLRIALRRPEARRLPSRVVDPEAATRHERMARDFATLSSSAREQTLLLTGTHNARRDFNERV
jgi:hypothetical protein